MAELVLLYQASTDGDRMDRDAEKGTADVSALEQFVYNAIDRGGSNGDRPAPRQGRVVEADDSAGCVDQRSSGESVVDGKIEPEKTVDPRSLPGAPAFMHRADHAETRGTPRPR